MSKKNTNPEPLFQIERFIEAVNEDSQRSRSLMVALVFAALLVSIALVNSVKQQYSWYKSRINVKKVAQEWLVFPDDPDSIRVAAFVDMRTFVAAHEKMYGNDNLAHLQGNEALESSVPYWVKIKKPGIHIPEQKDPLERLHLYEKISMALHHIESSNTKSRHEINIAVDELIRVHIEHLMLVRIPILGISFDVNYLGVFGGATFISLYLLLYYSLVREYRNLKTLFKRAWGETRYHQHQFYEFISMYQVLDVPKRLYSAEKTSKDKWLRQITSSGHLFPALVLLGVLSYDAYTAGIGSSVNSAMVTLTSLFTLFFLLVIIILLYMIYRQEEQMNILWDNQACEFNIEYVLELIGEDEIDIEELKGKTLTSTEDKILVLNIKEMFFETFSSKMRGGRNISTKKSIQLLESYLHLMFKKAYVGYKNENRPDPASVNGFWEDFKDWFRKNGRHNIEKEFRTTFCEMVHDYFKGRSKNSTGAIKTAP